MALLQHLIDCALIRGESQLDFIAAVELHAEVRKLDQNDGWWVCAYANNQHCLSDDINADPKSLDFAKCHFYDFDFDGDRKVPAGTHGPNIRQHI